MIRSILPLLLLAPGIAAPARAAPVVAPAPSAVLDQVSRHLRGVQSLTASFVQTNRDGKAVSGTLSLKQPGRVRFQYQKGVPLLIVGDGHALTMIDYSVRQVSRWPVGNSPLGVLLDPRKDLSRVATVVELGDPRRVAIAARDPKHPEFGTTTIVFDRAAGGPAGLMLAGWSTMDAQGNRTTVTLSGQRINAAIPDSTFRWNDPRRSGPRG